MALLFFLDHLMQKNGRRTIHDLSCQFGARGFTQEMRDAVGTTQEGLTDFLSQYPSLFTVEGDQIILKGYGEVDGKNQLSKVPPNGRNRDYDMEAVEFFEAKLHKFGPELQIKSLLGHRSQAAPEVRLVSGRHLKEFVDFLAAQVDHFVVEGDRVRLKRMPEPSEEAVELDDEGKPLAGIKAKQAAVDFLKGVLEQNEEAPIPLDAFYRRFCERFPHAVRQEVATNPKELLQFLKLNRNIFFIRSNKVSLVKNRPEENGSESGRSTESVDSMDNNNGQFLLNKENLHRIHLVKALKPAQEVVQSLFEDVNAQADKFVGIDFKLVKLGGQTEEFLSLIVVASTMRIGVFDMANSDSILLESGLKNLLESEAILKVMHDIKRVSTLLAQRYAVNMRRVFDTQVAHAVIQHEKFNKSFPELRAIPFINLRRVYYPQSLMLTDLTPRSWNANPNWGSRPITDDLLLSAAEECHTLVNALYRLLNSHLAQMSLPFQNLFEEKCLEALVPSPSKPPPQIPQATSVYRPPARRTQNSIITPITASPPPAVSPNNFLRNNFQNGTKTHMNGNRHSTTSSPHAADVKPKMVEAATQTFSTGEITVLNVYFDQ